MKCPKCQTDLMISDRQGIEIDFCPQCRGVWLDRGGLDKLIERASRYGGDGDDDEHRYRSEHRPEYSALGTTRNASRFGRSCSIEMSGNL